MEIEITQLHVVMARTPTPATAGATNGGAAHKRLGAKKVLMPPRASKKASNPAWLRRAEEEIKNAREADKLLIPKAPFGRLVKEVAQDAVSKGVIGQHRWQALGVQELQEQAEFFLSELFADAELAARHAKRVTVTPKDLALAIRMRRLDVNGSLLHSRFR